jgi:hypothetical protein
LPARAAYIQAMRRKPIDMRSFHAEPTAIEADKIAARHLHALRQNYAGKLRLSDVKEMFQFMPGQS